MEIDITKYQKNKDIELSNDDINVDKLVKDIRKGFISTEDFENEKKELLKENATKYADLESKYNSLEKSYNDVQSQIVEKTNKINDLNLRNDMRDLGFDQDKFERISTLRKTVYSEEKDDFKALEKIKEEFGASLITTQKSEQKFDVPEENKFNNSPKKEPDIKITRKTNIRDLIKH